MASSRNGATDTQTFTSLLMLASAIAAMSSFLLFGLQPLAVAKMGHWHAPATVVHLFQWTYLAGVTLTALSSSHILVSGQDEPNCGILRAIVSPWSEPLQDHDLSINWWWSTPRVWRPERKRSRTCDVPRLSYCLRC